MATAKRAKAKVTAKKPAKKTSKKTTVKKTTRKVKAKATIKAAPRTIKAITAKLTKSQILTMISEDTELTRVQVKAVFSSLGDLIQGQMKKRGFGELTIPETGVKIRRHRKPATKKRKMISPFTGEEITVKAKPARNVVKLSALKALKETVE